MSEPHVQTSFSPDEIDAFSPTMKIGLLATVNPDGLPHLTLVASLQANSPTQMIFGQFTEGLSKKHVRQDPKAGWLIMTLDRQIWRGKATFTHTAKQGPEFEMYNNTPMFRYNAYFGVHTVFFLDLLEHAGKMPLPMGRVVFAAVQTMIARALGPKSAQQPVLNLWTRQLMNKLDNLKFLSYIGPDGYPRIIPTIQAMAAGSDQIIYSTGAFSNDLHAIPPGSSVAVFGMSLQMEDVLMRGKYLGLRRIAGIRCGSVAVDWVYNPMPPKPQQIYPRVDVEPVRAF
ncbi:MAG: hypothetical protein GWN58_38720 [Anaerolineae bacterium]|nr:hypothetical protein [Anaerolineae bacterium]